MPSPVWPKVVIGGSLFSLSICANFCWCVRRRRRSSRRTPRQRATNAALPTAAPATTPVETPWCVPAEIGEVDETAAGLVVLAVVKVVGTDVAMELGLWHTGGPIGTIC